MANGNQGEEVREMEQGKVSSSGSCFLFAVMEAVRMLTEEADVGMKNGVTLHAYLSLFNFLRQPRMG